MKTEVSHKRMEKERRIGFWMALIFLLISVVLALFNHVEFVVICVGLSIICVCKAIYWDLKDMILYKPKIKKL